MAKKKVSTRDYKPKINANKPTVLMAVGDPEDAYTGGKIWHLIKRVTIQHPEWNVVGITHDREVAQRASKIISNLWLVDIKSTNIDDDQRIVATDELIRATHHICVPGTELSLAKILALDDFAGSLSLLGAYPPDEIKAACMVVPMTGVDNNTRFASGLYGWLLATAYKQDIPVVGLEVSPLGNKHVFSQLPAQQYALKSLWSQNFLSHWHNTSLDHLHLLAPEEKYLVSGGTNTYRDAFMRLEDEVRKMLEISHKEFVVLIPHHVTFIWEIRRIIEELSGWQDNTCVLIRTDPATHRRGMTESQLAFRSYNDALQLVRHGVIDERVGMGLLLQIADVVIAPYASIVTEMSQTLRVPTIICQAAGEEGSENDLTIWEPRPEQVPHILSMWRGMRIFQRDRLGDIIANAF